jgi:hypothetical protein
MDDINLTIKNANIEGATNLIHFVIAYLKDNVNKNEEDYAINSILFHIINNLCDELENDKIELHKDELKRICQGLIFMDNE